MAMMGLMGTVVGASAVGIAGVARSAADTVLPRMVGSVDHRHQMAMHLHGQRCEAIQGWRAGLADARDVYQQWACGPRDGDLFGRAGAAFDDDIEANDIHHCMNTSWLFGGADMAKGIGFRTNQAEAYSAFMSGGREACGQFERPFVSWRNDIALFMGPRQTGYSALDVDDLTAVEVRSHRLMSQHLDFFRANAPGFESAYLLQSAPQIGVRHSRRLKGVGAVLRSQWPNGVALADEVGVSPAVSPKFPNISVPYGALVPETLDGLIACGRHISCDRNSHGFMREIPQCWLTGQAAGTAAALAASAGIRPRDLNIARLQEALISQGVYLRRSGASERPSEGDDESLGKTAPATA